MSMIDTLPDATGEVNNEPVQSPTDETPPAPDSTEVQSSEQESTTETSTPTNYGLLGEDYIPPETFENENAELEFYRSRYAPLINELSSENFVNKLQEAYGSKLIEYEDELKQMSTHIKAMQNNPREYIKQYFPEKLAEIGVIPTLSEEEITKRIDQDLRQEFGDDYEQMYVPGDVVKPTSFSAKVMVRSMQLQKDYAEKNIESEKFYKEYNDKLASNVVPAQQVDEQKILDDAFKELSETVSIKKEDFDSFVGEMKNKQLNFTDFYRVVNFDKLIKQAEERGFAEGKKTTSKAINQTGKIIAANGQVSKDNLGDTPDDKLSREVKALRSGKIDMYSFFQ